MMLGEELNFAANPFIFQWERRAGNNLCIAGLDDSIRPGMLRSLLTCAKQNQMFDNIVYFNTDPYKTLNISDIDDGIVLQDSTWDGNISEWTSEYFKAKCSLLIIDAIDDANARMFHPKPVSFGVKKDTTEAPAESLKRLLDEGPRHGSFVVAFVDNWNNFSTSCRGYLNLFELRIGFQLTEEDAGSLASGSMGGKRIKGLEDGRKAIFVNRQRNIQTWFRPFVVPIDGENQNQE